MVEKRQLGRPGGGRFPPEMIFAPLSLSQTELLCQKSDVKKRQGYKFEGQSVF